MKVIAINANNRRRSFEIKTRRGDFDFPYTECDPEPTATDPIARLFIDPELGREGFTYVLQSGLDGSVLVDHVFDYNEEPRYMRDLLLYNLTVEALDRLEKSRLSKREVIRRLGTSPAQFYRLLDATNHRKSVDKMLMLLWALGAEVEVTVRDKKTADSARLRESA